MSVSIKSLLYLGCVCFILFESCKSRTFCPEGREQTKAKIVSITVQQRVDSGEQVAITIGVRNNNAICTKEANASISNINLDTLTVSANLSYANNDAATDCDCKRDSIIYTLLYFKPLNKGMYYIVTEADSSVYSNQPNDALGQVINVE